MGADVWPWEAPIVGSTLAASVPNARELLAEFKATGDQGAYEEIVRRYAGMVFGVCLRTTKNTHDAEDATQAVFLSLAVQCKTGDGVKYVGPWLQQVAKRVSLDIKRSRKRRETRELRHHALNGNGNGHTEVEKAGAIDVDELKGVLGEELSQLPSKYRLPLILHYFGGLTRDEMAKELNCKPATLGVRIHRGREMLGRRLHERGAAPPGLVLSAFIAGSIQQSIGDALVARTVEAAAKLSLGQDLSAMISSHVLAVSKTAAMGALLGAKLKIVAAILLVVCMMAVASGAVAKLAPINLKLPGFFKFDWLPNLRSPLRVPQFTSAQPAPPVGNQGSPTESISETALPRSEVTPVGVSVWPDKQVGAMNGSKSPFTTGSGGPQQYAVAAKPAAARPAQSGTTRGPDLASAHAGSSLSHRATRKSQVSSSRGDASSENLLAVAPTSRDGDVTVTTTDSASSIGAGGNETPVTLTRSTLLSVASAGGSSGGFGIFGGNVEYDLQEIGRGGNGVVDHFGGSNTFKQLRLGIEPGSRGVYNARGGAALRVKRGGPEGFAGIEVGKHGSGELNLGDADSTGNIFAAGEPLPGEAEPSLVVRGDSTGSGKIEGVGTVSLGGTFENNGEVIANGYRHGRSLDFDGFKQVVNSIENPPVNGAHGWYARDGGRLALPGLPVAAGTNTYTWGESPNDDVIDLVNSARITFHDLPTDGYMDIALMALDRGGVPPLPKGHTFIGIWQLDTFGLVRNPDTGVLESGALVPGGIDFIVRYDDALADQLGLNENVLKLWKYQDGHWSRILDSLERHPDLNILTGHTSGGVAYFAVSAPEPGAAALLLLAGGFTLARRRRRNV